MFLGRDRGWTALEGDIGCLCKILQFKPSHTEMHYLLRVQNAEDGGLRLSPPLIYEEAFTVFAVSMLYRALVYRIPSYLFYEDVAVAKQWVHSFTVWGQGASEPLRGQLQVSKRRNFLTANGVHICHAVGPWTKDGAFRPGKQDIALPDFDLTPTDRIERVCDLTVGSILYVPYGSLAKPAHSGKASNRRRGDLSS